jgi:hypothetical protein
MPSKFGKLLEMLDLSCQENKAAANTKKADQCGDRVKRITSSWSSSAAAAAATTMASCRLSWELGLRDQTEVGVVFMIPN